MYCATGETLGEKCLNIQSEALGVSVVLDHSWPESINGWNAWQQEV